MTRSPKMRSSKGGLPPLPLYTLTKLPPLTPPLDPFYRELFQRKPEFKMNLGLENIRKVLNHYGNPHRELPVILIAGTNGKGSTVRFLERNLLRCKYKVASYLSPHIVHPRERFRIMGEEVAEEELLPLLKELFERHPELTFFELLTVAAFLLFRVHQVELAIMEIGLGGRLDAVNVCEHVLATVITSIGFDHREILGDTLEAIAKEKGGIIRPGVPLFTGDLPQEAIRVYAQMTQELNTPWIQIPQESGPPELPTYLVNNIALAQTVAETIFGLKPLTFEELFPARPIGRFTILSYSPLKLVDGAHNPPGAHALAQAIKKLDLEGVHGYIRIGRSKEAKPFLLELAPQIQHFYLAQETEPEWYSGEELKNYLPKERCTLLPLPDLFDHFLRTDKPALFTGTLRGLQDLFLRFQISPYDVP